MDYEQITYEVRGDVALITLNRPDRLNAWTPRMAQEQIDAIRRADADPAVGAIVTTGAGRGFCAGADMEATFQARQDGAAGGMPEDVDWVSFCRAAKPMVAAINGPAVGIGLTMCLPMDQIVAAPSAKLGLLFVKMGLVPELASSRLLTERVGFGKASDLCLSGRVIRADEAAAIGLVDQLAADDDALLEHALGVAASYAANPAPQLRMIKDLLTANGVEPDLAKVREREHAYLDECFASAEHREAVQAFLQKRPPVFTR